MALYQYIMICKVCKKKIAVKSRRQKKCIDCKKSTEYFWENYNSTFYRNKKIVLKRDKNTCQCCKTKVNLIVHHIDCDKQNNSPSNLITLCKQCHAYLHKKHTNQELRINNINNLFPKNFLIGELGRRPIV